MRLHLMRVLLEKTARVLFICGFCEFCMPGGFRCCETSEKQGNSLSLNDAFCYALIIEAIRRKHVLQKMRRGTA